MVPTQQYLIFGKSQTPRRCLDKIGKLTRRLSAVTPHLIDLTGSGLYVEDGTVFHGLLYSRIDNPWMSGTDRIDAPFSRAAITDQYILQAGACVAAALNQMG